MKKFLLLFVAVFAFGGDFEDGQAAYERSNFVVARDKFASACDANNALACAKLGALYQLGKDILPDPKKALELYEKGCELGAKEGCSGAGGMYVATDKEKARALLNKGCELGDGFSCATAGSYLLEEKKFKDAYALFEKACKNGDKLGCQFATDLKRSKRL